MTARDWFKRPDLIEDLGRLLDSPTISTALSVLIEEGLPQDTTATKADTPNLLTFNALSNAERTGYYNFLRNLRRLTLPPKVPIDPAALEPWNWASENL